MNKLLTPLYLSTVLTWLFWGLSVWGAETFTVASYNLEGYVEQAQGIWPAKTAAAKAKIRESIQKLSPDVLAIQEIGGMDALMELRDALETEGQTYAHLEIVSGFDTNLHVAVLSKFPIVARRPHPHEYFLLNGRRFQVTRGFAEVDIRVNPNYVFTLITTHLKSRRPVPTADEADLREQEAMRLREIIDVRLAANPDANILVAGDFNDTQDSRTVKAILGRGASKLFDTRPGERNGDNQPPPNPNYSLRNITWTHFYAKEDTYCRIDYILLSRGMTREWDPDGTCVLTLPNWGLGSDHRPIIARFFSRDK